MVVHINCRLGGLNCRYRENSQMVFLMAQRNAEENSFRFVERNLNVAANCFENIIPFSTFINSDNELIYKRSSTV